MSYSNVGKRWTVSSFEEYLTTIPRPSFAKAVCIHHCWAPSLAQRPNGFLGDHLRSLESFYRSKGWYAGPHGFTDEDEIHGMSPFTARGVHAVSFNRNSIGYEMLGNYDVEDPTTGRGFAVCQTTALVARATLQWLGLPIDDKTVLFHRDDPRTSKTCPGTKVKKDWFIDLVRDLEPAAPVPPARQEELVAVVPYIVEQTGVSFGDVAKDFKAKGKLYTYKSKWIEGAYYDPVKMLTLAPAAEIDEVLAAI